MIDQTLHEKIEAYLFGQMPPDEAAAFKQQIADEPKLAEAVELHRLILPIYETLEEKELHKKFDKWRAEMEGRAELEAEKPLPFLQHFIKKIISAFWGLFSIKNYRYQKKQKRNEDINTYNWDVRYNYPSPDLNNIDEHERLPIIVVQQQPHEPSSHKGDYQYQIENPYERPNASLILLFIALIGIAFLCWFYFVREVDIEKMNKPTIEINETGPSINDQLPKNNSDTTPIKIQEKIKRPLEKKEPIAAVQYDPECVQWADEGLIAYEDEMLKTFRTRGNKGNLPGEVLLGKADTAIIDKKYKEAVQLLVRVSPDDSKYYTKSLEMLAYAQFKSKQYEAAIETYKKYRTFNRSTYRTDWELCLFYLPVYPKYKKDLNILLGKIMSETDHPKYTQAVELKGKLEKK